MTDEKTLCPVCEQPLEIWTDGLPICARLVRRARSEAIALENHIRHFRDRLRAAVLQRNTSEWPEAK